MARAGKERAVTKDHDKAAKDLEREAQNATGEKANFLREANRLVKDKKVQQAMEELSADEAARERFKQDPQGYLRGKGVDLPADARVEYSEE